MSERMSVADFRVLLASLSSPKTNKYGAKSVWRCMDCGGAFVREKVCGSCQSTNTRRFDSKAEAAHYDELRIAERTGLIRKLECQPGFAIEINGVKVGDYIADFEYIEGKDQLRVVDVKGGDATDTPLSKFKRKCVKAIHGVTVEVVRR